MRAGIFTIVLILAFLLAKDVVSGAASGSSVIYVVLMVLVMMPLLFVGSRLKKKDRTVEQQQRTEHTISELATAGVLSDRPASGSLAQPPSSLQTPSGSLEGLVVFLRPFVADQIEVRNPALDGRAAFWIPLYKFLLPSAVAIDDGLRYALPASSTLVAISSDAGHIGAAKITRTDDDWKQAFEDLVTRASVILVVPGVRPGTQWEIQRLVQLRLLSKSLFILLPPPIVTGSQVSEALQFDAVKAMLAECGLRVPERTTSGAPISTGDLLAFDDAGAVAVHHPQVVTRGLISSRLNIREMKRRLEPMFLTDAGQNSRRTPM